MTQSFSKKVLDRANTIEFSFVNLMSRPYAGGTEAAQKLDNSFLKTDYLNEPKFTSLFLLKHSHQSFELFNIHSEEEYRLMVEINKAFDNLSTTTTDKNSAVYRINDSHSVIVADGNFTISNDSGDILGSISISNFARSPRTGFRIIKGFIS